jgi:hypothetical protein
MNQTCQDASLESAVVKVLDIDQLFAVSPRCTQSQRSQNTRCMRG